MRSRIFYSVVARLVLSGLFLCSFLNVHLVVGVGSGEIGDLIFIGVRASWVYAQILAWLGMALEITAALCVGSRAWRRAALAGWLVLVLSSACFVLRAENLHYLAQTEIWSSGAIFLAAAFFRLSQIRMKISQRDRLRDSGDARSVPVGSA